MVKGDNAHALGRTALNEVGDGPLVIIAGGGEPVHKDKGLFYPPWGFSALVTTSILFWLLFVKKIVDLTGG